LERGLSIARAELPTSHPTWLELIRGLRYVAPDLVILDDGRIIGDTGGTPGLLNTGQDPNFVR
jgi:hypothetical protein